MSDWMIGSRRAVGAFLVSTVLALMALPVAADGIEGSYRGLYNALTLDVSGGAAVVAVTSGACIGYLEGAVTEVGEGRWEILGSVAEAPCVLTVDRRADGSLEMNAGAGCSYYHGASCELSGVLGSAQ